SKTQPRSQPTARPLSSSRGDTGHAARWRAPRRLLPSRCPDRGVCQALQLPHYVLAEPIDRPLAGERDERHVARLAGLEAHGGARRDVEPHAARSFPVELQRRVGLEEMVVRPDLNRPVAGIGDAQCYGLAAGVQLDLAVLDEIFSGDHRSHLIGSCTVTSFVPSGNVASTCTSWIISGMPSITCARVITCAPSCISSATV